MTILSVKWQDPEHAGVILMDLKPSEPVIQEYLTATEAAEYACMPLADFLPAARRCGVVPFHLLYRKADIEAAMARGWRAV